MSGGITARLAFGLLLGAALMAASCLAVGYGFGTAHQALDCAETVAQVQSHVQTAVDDAASARAALDKVQQRLADQAETLDRYRRVAAQALQQRDALQRQLNEASRRRADALRKAIHESPDCAVLEHLPVCPAVAVRLFGGSLQADAPDRH